jgi:hypothetical protein
VRDAVHQFSDVLKSAAGINRPAASNPSTSWSLYTRGAEGGGEVSRLTKQLQVRHNATWRCVKEEAIRKMNDPKQYGEKRKNPLPS